MSWKKMDDYPVKPFGGKDQDNPGGWTGPGKKKRYRKSFLDSLSQAAGDLFAHFAWYDLILGPLTLLFAVMILFNLDAVLYWFAVTTLKLLDVSIVILLVVLGLLLLAAIIRGRRDRRNRRGGWFW